MRKNLPLSHLSPLILHLSFMKESKRPMSRASHDEEELQETPQILSSEEKRELILAHARSQSAKDPMQRMTVWGGVLISLGALAFGWWWTVGTSIQTTWRKGSPEFQAMTDSLNEFSKSLQVESEALKGPLTPTDSANASEYPDLLKAVMEGAEQNGRRNDLLAPARKTSTSTPSIQATSTVDQKQQILPIIDPNEPGLEPDTQELQ